MQPRQPRQLGNRIPRKPSRTDRPPSMTSPLDWLRGYMYFTRHASCYILGGCFAILCPLATCSGLIYYTLFR